MKTIRNGNLVRFIDADPSLTHLENMLQMADRITYNEFLIGGWETDRTYYIDERSHRIKNGIYVVKHIAENKKFFWYICPYCQQIHIESKRLLTHDKPIMATMFLGSWFLQKFQLNLNKLKSLMNQQPLLNLKKISNPQTQQLQPTAQQKITLHLQ